MQRDALAWISFAGEERSLADLRAFSEAAPWTGGAFGA